MIDKSANSERLTSAAILCLIGGFLDIYTYLFRGKVFANAVTGNLVLLGFKLSERDFATAGRYLLAIFSYAVGIFLAEIICHRLTAPRHLNWHQLVVLLEIICLIPVSFIPCGDWDFVVNALVAMVCAMQVQTFRRVRKLPFASTMCTGNLRSGSEALYRSVIGREPGELIKAFHYYEVIVFFVAGAALGAILLKYWGQHVLLLAPIGLGAVFFLIAPQSERRYWLRKIRNYFSGKKSPHRVESKRKPL